MGDVHAKDRRRWRRYPVSETRSRLLPVQTHADLVVFDLHRHHRRLVVRVSSRRTPRVQESDAVDDVVHRFVGVTSDTDSVCSGLVVDDAGDALGVPCSWTSAVGDDEGDPVDGERRHVRQVDGLAVAGPSHACVRSVRERLEPVDGRRRVEVASVDGVVRSSDPSLDPVGNLGRPPWDVCVADERQFHTSVSTQHHKSRCAGLPRDAMTHVVTVFLRRRGRILLVRRGDTVGTYRGQWGGVSGYVEGDPADALTDARRELAEEVGVLDATLVRAGDPVEVVDGDREWTVHPFLFDWSGERELTLNAELTTAEWVHPPAILVRETVPALWAAYAAVAPTVADVRDDETHGSAYISVRALEVLRDRAAVADDWESIATVARDLRDARPSMAALVNRVDRVMSEAIEAGRTPEAVLERAQDAVDGAVRADEDAAANAAERLSGTVLTLSRSGTVLDALTQAPLDAVVVAESRPAREGVDVADELARAGLDVTLTTDAAMGYVLAEEDVDAAVVGADTVFADGSVANKVGTRLLALAASRADVPFSVVAARDKIAPGDEFHPEFGDADEVYAGDRDVDVCNPVFDRTPGDLVAGVVTESVVLDTEDVSEVAAEHRRLAAWDDSIP